MPKFSVVTLLDRALLPATVLIAAKLISFFVASLIFDLGWQINFRAIENNFLFLEFNNGEDFSEAVNFSDTIAVLTCALGFSWTLFQAKHLSIDNSHPNVIARLYQAGKSFFLTNSGRAYYQSSIWLAFSWFLLFLVLVNVFQGFTSNFVLGLSLVTTIGLTYIFYDLVK